MSITKVIIACILWIVLDQRPSNSTPITSIGRSVPGELTVWMSSADVFTEPTPFSAIYPIFDTGEIVAVLLNRPDPSLAEITIIWKIAGNTEVRDTFTWVENSPISNFDGSAWNDIGTHRSFTYRLTPERVPDAGGVLAMLGLACLGIKTAYRITA